MIKEINIKLDNNVILQGEFAYCIKEECFGPEVIAFSMESLVIKTKDKKIYIKSDSSHHNIEVFVPADCVGEEVKKYITEEDQNEM